MPRSRLTAARVLAPFTLLLMIVAVAPAPAEAPSPLPPQATTGGSQGVGLGSATVAGTVSARGGATTASFEYGTSSRYGLRTTDQQLGPEASGAGVSAELKGLTTATTYHYRVVATNDAGVARGADRTFRTLAAPARPDVLTDPAFAVGPNGATIRGRVNAKGQPTSYSFEYGPTGRYGLSTPSADAGAGDALAAFSAPISGLRPYTVYHVRIRATNATGTRLGADRRFRTAKLPITLRLSRSASVVRYTRSVTLTGTATGTDKSGLRVRLERRNLPFSSDFRTGPVARTDGDGRVRFVVSPFTLPTEFRLVAVDRPLAVSAPVRVEVRAFVRLRAERLRGGRVRLRGTVSPANAEGTVALQRRLGPGRYVFVRRMTLRGRGPVRRFATTLRAPASTVTYRAATRLRGATLRDGASPTLRVRPRR